MTRRVARATLAAIVGMLLVPAIAHATPTQTLTIVNDNGVAHRTLVQTERAIVAQSQALRAYWHTPLVRFGRNGWPIYLVQYSKASSLGFAMRDGEAAFHDHTTTQPYAVVGERHRHQFQSVLLDHEILEMLVDPYGNYYINYELVEVVDPVNQYETRKGLADFVKPAFFALGHVRWYDWLHEMKS